MERGRPEKPGCFRPIGRGSPKYTPPPLLPGFTVNMQDLLDLSGVWTRGFLPLESCSKDRNQKMFSPRLYGHFPGSHEWAWGPVL